jgi:transcription elongation GreA/GreB family factor
VSLKKHKIIEQIQEYLTEELESLADPSGEEAERLKRLQLVYRFLPVKEYGRDEVIIPSALVELEFKKTIAYYFISPQCGGLITRVDGNPVQVITPQSPLGEALLGKKAGDTVQVMVRGAVRVYKILTVS